MEAVCLVVGGEKVPGTSELLGLTFEQRVEKTLKAAGVNLRAIKRLGDENSIEFLDACDSASTIVSIGQPVLDLEAAGWLKEKLAGRSFRGLGVLTGTQGEGEVPHFWVFSPEVWRDISSDFAKSSGDVESFLGNLAVQKIVETGRCERGVLLTINEPRDTQTAEKYLLRSCRKPTDGFVSRWLNRPLSLQITRFLVRTKLTPNAVTIASMSLACLAAGLAATGKRELLVVAGALLHLSSLLDGCDGEIARLKIEASELGAWLDSVLDRYADALFIAAMATGFWLQTHQFHVWPWALAALTGSFVNSYTAMKLDPLLRRRKNHLRFGRDTRLLICAIATMGNTLLEGLVVLAVLSNIVSVRRIGHLLSASMKYGGEGNGNFQRSPEDRSSMAV